MSQATATPTSPDTASPDTAPSDTASVPEVRDMLSRARCVVLDFDGPVARLFAGGHRSQESVAGDIADELLRIAASHGIELAGVRGSKDPHEVFGAYARGAAERDGMHPWRIAADEMHGALTTWELKSAEHAEPTPGAAAFIRAWSRKAGPRTTGVPSSAQGRLAVASNNHHGAITRYLERESLLEFFDGPVIGRNEGDVGLMKPNPWILHEVVRATGADAAEHLMIGDSLSDQQAARSAGMPFLGYHRKAGKRQLLRAPGPDGRRLPVIATMQVLADAASAL
ncbi:HAD-IA family hydrolase [Streptomyces sp. NBC_00378]|uniref:HAD family hydrolase n=1 Tax=unclassified Streptomyces TaxID=2593676 RepID=UPI002252D4BA|nr:MULTISPECIES: HAD-IA family hydrolase [unclassified Streptomyces]MCX5110445.1 HAD-IA family hydrolase [Streptomyces sp. NBC_00378]